MNNIFLHPGDRFIMKFPAFHPVPLYLRELSFSPAYGFHVEWCKTKKSAMRLSAFAAKKVAKFFEPGGLWTYREKIEIIEVKA